MSRKRTFTRDIEVDDDGGVYTSNSHFPSWMIEDAQPTLIHIDPGMPADPIEALGADLYAQHCNACHVLPEMKAPQLTTLKRMPFARLSRSLEFGIMMQQAAHLSSDERYAIAKYLSSEGSTARDKWIEEHSCNGKRALVITSGVEDNWGFGAGNARSIDDAAISPANVNDLRLQWALAVPGATEMRSQPVAANGTLFVGTSNGNLLAIDQQTGCIQWRFPAASSIRSSLNSAAARGASGDTRFRMNCFTFSRV